MRSTRPISYEAALQRAASLCSRSEQCSTEIRAKLVKWGLNYSDIEKMMDRLFDLKYIDDRRFAEAFAHDKLNFSGWGKKKIYQALRLKRLPADIIREAIDEIEEREYKDVLKKILLAKTKSLGSSPLDMLNKVKLIRHLMSRGFEYEIISEMLQRQIEEDEDEEDDE